MKIKKQKQHKPDYITTGDEPVLSLKDAPLSAHPRPRRFHHPIRARSQPNHCRWDRLRPRAERDRGTGPLRGLEPRVSRFEEGAVPVGNRVDRCSSLECAYASG